MKDYTKEEQAIYDEMWCDYHNQTLNMKWEIEVTMKSNPFGRHCRVTITDGDIEKACIIMSKMYPTEEVRLRGYGMLRAIFIDGENTHQFRKLSDMLHGVTSANEHTWKSMYPIITPLGKE